MPRRRGESHGSLKSAIGGGADCPLIDPRADAAPATPVSAQLVFHGQLRDARAYRLTCVVIDREALLT